MKHQGNQLRHELKYYIDIYTYHILRERISHVIDRDENMTNDEGYLIGSLYFDDMTKTALNDKINGTQFRKKFRIRAYNRSPELIRLECKEKFDSVIAKRNAPLSIDEYASILQGDYDFLASRDERVCRELFGYNRAHHLFPTTIVEYLREAYVCDQGNVRITFDKNITASIYELDLFDKDLVLSSTLPPNTVVLEVKYDDFMPSYIKQLLQGLPMVQCAISKYVMCKTRNVRVRHYD